MMSKNRERLFGLCAAEALFGEVARASEPLGNPRIEAWASVLSFKGTKRSDQTRQSESDLDAKFLRRDKAKSKESTLRHLASGLVTKACGLGGNADALATPSMAGEHTSGGRTLAAD